MSDVNIKERRKYFKREARFLLRYNYIKQVFMTALIAFISFGIRAVKFNIGEFLEFEYNLESLPLEMVFDLILLLITVPLYIGIIYVNAGLFEGDNMPVSGMFQYFTSPANLIDCYRFILSMGARLIAFILPFFVFGAIIASGRELLGEIFPGNITADIVMLCISAFYILVFAICAVFMTRYFAAVFIFVKNPCLSVYDVIKKSSQLMKRKKIESLKLIFSFAFWIVLSHYLAGILFIFFTLPYIMLSYTSYMSYLLIEKEKDGEFLSPANDYINNEDENLRAVMPETESNLCEIFENAKSPFDIIDIDENYTTVKQFDSGDTKDTDIMKQKTKIK